MFKDIVITIESFLLVVITLWAVLFTNMATDLRDKSIEQEKQIQYCKTIATDYNILWEEYNK